MICSVSLKEVKWAFWAKNVEKPLETETKPNQHFSPSIKAPVVLISGQVQLSQILNKESTCPEHFNLVSLFTLPKELLWTSANSCGLPYTPVNPFAFTEQNDFLMLP